MHIKHQRVVQYEGGMRAALRARLRSARGVARCPGAACAVMSKVVIVVLIAGGLLYGINPAGARTDVPSHPACEQPSPTPTPPNPVPGGLTDPTLPESSAPPTPDSPAARLAVLLKQVGPGAERLGETRWALGLVPATADVITFGRRGHKLVFRRVKAPTGDLFVCVTELPVGAVVELVQDLVKQDPLKRVEGDTKLEDRRDAWKDLDTLLRPTVIRHGPIAWEWDRRARRMGIRQLWMRTIPGLQYNREYNAGPPPTAFSPIQYVSPQAAVYIADLFGCRLPTSNEWRATKQYALQPVATDSTQQADPRIDNLRDRTWNDYYKNVRKLVTDGRADDPAEGRFPYSASDSGVASDDHVIWFRDVFSRAAGPQNTPRSQKLSSNHTGSPDAFCDLRGNVWEWTYDVPEGRPYIDHKQLLDLFSMTKGRPDAEALRRFWKQFSVAGGSAISPQPKSDEVVAIDDKIADAMGSGFSDVGIRLVFRVPE